MEANLKRGKGWEPGQLVRCHRKHPHKLVVHIPQQLLHHNLLLHVPCHGRRHSVLNIRDTGFQLKKVKAIN